MHFNNLLAALTIAFSTVLADGTPAPLTKEQLAEAYPPSEPSISNYYPTSLFGFEYVSL
jgi:hypothetical protein